MLQTKHADAANKMHIDEYCKNLTLALQTKLICSANKNLRDCKQNSCPLIVQNHCGLWVQSSDENT